jgi:hypothetical protein
MLDSPGWLAVRQAFNPFASGRKRAASLELAAQVVKDDMKWESFRSEFIKALQEQSKGEIVGTLTDSRGLATKTLSRAQGSEIKKKDKTQRDAERNELLAHSAWEYLEKAKIVENGQAKGNSSELCKQAARRQRVAEGGKEAIKLGLWITAAVLGTVFTAGGLPALGAFATLTVFAIQGVLVAAGVATVTPHRLIPSFLRPIFPRLTSIGKGARALAEITINPNPEKRGILARGVMAVLQIGGNKLDLERKIKVSPEPLQQKTMKESLKESSSDESKSNSVLPSPPQSSLLAIPPGLDVSSSLSSSSPSSLLQAPPTPSISAVSEPSPAAGPSSVPPLASAPTPSMQGNEAPLIHSLYLQ